jgi:hypothetical protein
VSHGWIVWIVDPHDAARRKHDAPMARTSVDVPVPLGEAVAIYRPTPSAARYSVETSELDAYGEMSIPSKPGGSRG